MRYDISFNPERGRWYVDATCRMVPASAPTPNELAARPVSAVDLNHDHLAAWIITPGGNPHGASITVPIHFAGCRRRSVTAARAPRSRG